MFILEILKSKGYQEWRHSCVFPQQNADAKTQNAYILQNKGKFNVTFVKGNEVDGSFFFKAPDFIDFSSMRVGGIAKYYVRENDFYNPVIWGLSEVGKPPTLIFPRPKISRENYDEYKSPDDIMNMVLSKYPHEEIFTAMFDKSITLTV